MRAITNSYKLFKTLFLILIFNFISCDDKNNINADCENVVCTFEHRTIDITVFYQNQNPVALDTFKVIDAVTGSDYTISLTANQFTIAQETGRYPLANDESFDVNQEHILEFKGYINNTEAVGNTYKIRTDCCHIELISGDLQLEIN